MGDDVTTWPQDYPSPEEIVDASLSAGSYDEECLAFEKLGIPSEHWCHISHMVASASHGVWLFPEVVRITDIDDHPIYRVAQERTLRGVKRLLEKPDPTRKEQKLIDHIQRQRAADAPLSAREVAKYAALSVLALLAFLIVCVGLGFALIAAIAELTK